ncbi:MAG: DUF6516 family protein [Candidatus Eremiobacterota bacterium]
MIEVIKRYKHIIKNYQIICWDSDLIIRWDNAFHWKNIDTFPHHKHQNNEVLSSREFNLQDVLQYISEIL